jgi:hypothetical protein
VTAPKKILHDHIPAVAGCFVQKIKPIRPTINNGIFETTLKAFGMLQNVLSSAKL